MLVAIAIYNDNRLGSSFYNYRFHTSKTPMKLCHEMNTKCPLISYLFTVGNGMSLRCIYTDITEIYREVHCTEQLHCLQSVLNMSVYCMECGRLLFLASSSLKVPTDHGQRDDCANTTPCRCEYKYVHHDHKCIHIY